VSQVVGPTRDPCDPSRFVDEFNTWFTHQLSALFYNFYKGAIASKIIHAIKHKTSHARLAQLLQPSLAFCFRLQPMMAYPGRYAVIGCKLKQNADESCNNCASIAGLVLFLFRCMFYFTCDRFLTLELCILCSFCTCECVSWFVDLWTSRRPPNFCQHLALDIDLYLWFRSALAYNNSLNEIAIMNLHALWTCIVGYV